MATAENHQANKYSEFHTWRTDEVALGLSSQMVRDKSTGEESSARKSWTRQVKASLISIPLLSLIFWSLFILPYYDLMVQVASLKLLAKLHTSQDENIFLLVSSSFTASRLGLCTWWFPDVHLIVRLGHHHISTAIEKCCVLGPWPSL